MELTILKPLGYQAFAAAIPEDQLDPVRPTTDILHTRFSLFDDCLSLAPSVRKEGAGLAVQAWQELNLHLHG